MGKWVDASSSSDNEEEDLFASSRSQIEEDANEDNDSGSNSGSDSEAELYKATAGGSGKEQIDSNEYDSYKPTENNKLDFMNQLNIIRDAADEVNEKILSMTHNIDAESYEVKYGLSYFDAKQNMLIMYIEQLIAFFQLKLQAEEPIDGTPLIKSLLYTKGVIERSKIIDLKLKPQIDRLLSLALNQGEEEANYKSRILDEGDEDAQGQHKVEDEEAEAKAKAKRKYEVKKNMIEFFETKNEKKTRRRQIEKDKERIRHSEVIQSLRDEITDNPNVINYSNTHYDKFMKQVEDHEDETFQRMTIAKNKLKQLRKKDRKEEDLRYFDRDLKQMTNVLLHDNEDAQEEKERKSKFLQRKREMNRMSSQMLSSTRPKPGKKQHRFNKKH